MLRPPTPPPTHLLTTTTTTYTHHHLPALAQQDFICNWVGNKQWVDVLPWAGAARWAAAADEAWVVRGKQAGTVRAVGPLSFVRVFDAGHMVRLHWLAGLVLFPDY